MSDPIRKEIVSQTPPGVAENAPGRRPENDPMRYSDEVPARERMDEPACREFDPRSWGYFPGRRGRKKRGITGFGV